MKFYPNGYHGVDRHGRPVYYQEVGHLDVKRLLEVTTEKDIVRLFVKNFELFLLRLAPSCAVQMGRPVTQYTTVMDMKGVGLRHFTAQSRAILHATSVISEAHYPETMAKVRHGRSTTESVRVGCPRQSPCRRDCMVHQQECWP